VLYQGFSILWFSPLLFAHKWMGYLGKTLGDFNGESITGLLFSFISAILFVYLLAWLFQRLNIQSGLRGLGLGFLTWLGCFFLQTLTQDSFSLRPVGLTLINSGILLINFCITGLVLGSWKKLNSKRP
jgi:Na+/proline symporter